jgi:hypothetical protein
MYNIEAVDNHICKYWWRWVECNRQARYSGAQECSECHGIPGEALVAQWRRIGKAIFRQ